MQERTNARRAKNRNRASVGGSRRWRARLHNGGQAQPKDDLPLQKLHGEQPEAQQQRQPGHARRRRARGPRPRSAPEGPAQQTRGRTEKQNGKRGPPQRGTGRHGAVKRRAHREPHRLRGRCQLRQQGDPRSPAARATAPPLLATGATLLDGRRGPGVRRNLRTEKLTAAGRAPPQAHGKALQRRLPLEADRRGARGLQRTHGQRALGELPLTQLLVAGPHKTTLRGEQLELRPQQQRAAKLNDPKLHLVDHASAERRAKTPAARRQGARRRRKRNAPGAQGARVEANARRRKAPRLQQVN